MLHLATGQNREQQAASVRSATGRGARMSAAIMTGFDAMVA